MPQLPLADGLVSLVRTSLEVVVFEVRYTEVWAAVGTGVAAAMNGGRYIAYNSIDKLRAPGVTWRELQPTCREKGMKLCCDAQF